HGGLEAGEGPGPEPADPERSVRHALRAEPGDGRHHRLAAVEASPPARPAPAATLMPITEALLEATFVLWGLCIGSFLNVCIHRVPLRQSVASPRSRCPQWGSQLSCEGHVPVLSYALLRGRCRSCANPISLRYPI